MNKRAVGTEFEAEAADFLVRNGYQILEKNYRCKIGEIDIIARDQDYLCFVEVKYRSSTSKGFPAEAINRNKIRKITKTAQLYMLRYGLDSDTPCRFDAVVILDREFTLLKNAFDSI